MTQPTISITDLTSNGANGSLDIRIYNINNQPMMPQSTTASVVNQSVQVVITSNLTLSGANQSNSINKTYNGTPSEILNNIMSDVVLDKLLVL